MADKTLTISVKLDGNKETVTGIQKTTTALTKMSKQQQAVGASAKKAGAQKIDFKKMAGESNNARESMLNLQYSLRDSPYLFQSLQMGVTAAGENIGLLVQSMAQLKGEAGGTKNMLGVLKGALSGPAGIGVAISATLFVVQSLTFIFAKMKRNAKEGGEEVEVAAWSFDILKSSVEDTKTVLDQLSFKQIIEGMRTLNAEYEKLKQQNKEASSVVVGYGTGGMVVDNAAVKKAKENKKATDDLLAEQEAIRNKVLADAAKGKMSAARMDEFLLLFNQERNRRVKEMLALSDVVVKSVKDKHLAGIDAIDKQIKSLTTSQGKLGDLQSVELQLAEKSLQLKEAKGDVARKAILDEIKALEELQKKLKFEEDAEKGSKKKSGKTDAELQAEYDAKRAALEAQLAILRGERTELEVLAAREAALNAEKLTATKERQHEIELELLNIAIDREKIAQRTASEREKEAEAHAKALDKIADQQRKNELARGENTLLSEGAGEKGAIQARLQMQMAAFNARKKSLQDELNALEQSLNDGTTLTQSEHDKRVLLAEQMKGQIIGIEGKILSAKQKAAQQSADAETRSVQQRVQAMQSMGMQMFNTFSQVYGQYSQSMAAIDQYQVNKHRERLEDDREQALSKAKTEEQRASIEKKYDDEIAANDAALKAKQAKEQTRMFKFQQGVTFANAQMNAVATYPKVMEQMGTLGPFVAPAMVLMALAQAAQILTYKAPGYATGGRPIKVSNGESYLDEATFQKLLPQVMMLQKTGLIRGAGTGTSDSIPAIADGGFVLNESTTRQLRGFADGGDVLNRDLVIPEPDPVDNDSAVVEAINNLSSRIDRNSSMIMWYIKHPPPSKAVLDKKQSAAILNVAEYDVNRGRLQ